MCASVCVCVCCVLRLVRRVYVFWICFVVRLLRFVRLLARSFGRSLVSFYSAHTNTHIASVFFFLVSVDCYFFSGLWTVFCLLLFRNMYAHKQRYGYCCCYYYFSALMAYFFSWNMCVCVFLLNSRFSACLLSLSISFSPLRLEYTQYYFLASSSSFLLINFSRFFFFLSGFTIYTTWHNINNNNNNRSKKKQTTKWRSVEGNVHWTKLWAYVKRIAYVFSKSTPYIKAYTDW